MDKKSTFDITKSDNLLLPGTNLEQILAQLPEETKNEILANMASCKVELALETIKKVSQSNIAQNDFNNFAKNLEQLTKGKKLFAATTEGETGSGTYNISVKGVGW